MIRGVVERNQEMVFFFPCAAARKKALNASHFSVKGGPSWSLRPYSIMYNEVLGSWAYQKMGQKLGNSQPTRGSGKLEGFLSRWRQRILHQMIPDTPYSVVLDIGCGAKPEFLLNTKAKVKIGLDQVNYSQRVSGFFPIHCQFTQAQCLPLKSSSVELIVMAAFLEHLHESDVQSILKEAYRILVPGGTVAITTPHANADRILKFLAYFNLVSREEIEEHKTLFTEVKLRELIENAGFVSSKINIGSFQAGLNLWANCQR